MNRSLLAKSVVDTSMTELTFDHVSRTLSQLELAIVGYLGWPNQARLHESVGDLARAEFEAVNEAKNRLSATDPTNRVFARTSSAQLTPLGRSEP